MMNIVMSGGDGGRWPPFFVFVRFTDDGDKQGSSVHM